MVNFVFIIVGGMALVKKLSKFLSVLLVLAVFISNIAVVSYAKEDKNDLKGYETDINEIVEDLREAMSERDNSFTIKYATKTLYNNDTFSDFINNLYATAISETEESDEGDYLYYTIEGYSTDNTDVRLVGDKYYYDIPFLVNYYTTKKQEDAIEKKIEEVIKSFKFNKNTTDKDKCDKIYRYITSRVVYDYKNLNDDKHILKYTAYAALINGTAVCQGYATLFYRMAKECGLDTRIISGKSRNEGHAWNIVKIDGLYYYLDSTWDAGTNTYRYYLKGSKDFADHKCDANFETKEFVAAYPIDTYNYGHHSYEKREDNFSVSYICKVCRNKITQYKIPMGETLAQDTDGKWYYFADGVKIAASTLITFNGKLCYVKDGVWNRTANCLVFNGKKYYYIKNGVWDQNYTKIVKSGAQNVYIKDGIKSTATGFVMYEGKEHYLKNGVWTKEDTFVKVGSKYYYLKGGIKSITTGFVKYGGKERYLKNGVWTKENSFVKVGSKYYYVKEGIKSSDTGFVKSGSEYRYIKKGVWTKVTDFIKYKNKEYYVKKGVRSADTGFVKFDGKYYQIKKGVRTSTATFEKCGNAYLRILTTEYTYNGEAKKPSVKIYDSKGKTLSSKYYTITYAKGRKNVGKYKVTVKFKGKYSGTKKFYFTITPDDTSVSKVTASKNSLKVTLKKKLKQVTGYQIQYSTSKDFKSAKTKTVSSYKKTSVTLKSLKAKKTYYVRVRTYKKVDGKKYYSEWSKVKSKKTK